MQNRRNSLGHREWAVTDNQGAWEALFISVASCLGWVVGQLQGHSLADRKELIWRRKRAVMMDRYVFRLEHELSSRDIELPEKPEGYDEFVHDEF